MKKDKYLYNFEHTGRDLVDNGLSDGSYHELLCYSRYMMFNNHLKSFVIRESMMKFFGDNITLFDENKIDSVLNKAKNLGNLIVAQNIQFGYTDFLRIIDNRKFRKLIYVMICLSKLDHSFPYYNRGINYANSFANTRMSKKELNEFEFLMNQYISPVGIKNTKLNLPIEEVGKTEIPFSNIMAYFPDYCEGCNCVIYKESNSQKLCKICYKGRKNRKPSIDACAL